VTGAIHENADHGPLGLPEGITACLFDMDGVITDTAGMHAAAWKEMFDAFLARWTARTGVAGPPFDIRVDYDDFVDGRPREDGTRSFLASRGIHLPEGDPSDPPDAETVWGLSNRKNEIIQSRIARDGVHVYASSIRYVETVRDRGIRRAVVTSSANAHRILSAAHITHLFDVVVDGVVIARAGLRGKPAPDALLEAAQQLGSAPAAAAVFDDALSGVAAGRAGGFRMVVGVDRSGQASALREHGADLVVSDLDELLRKP